MLELLADQRAVLPRARDRSAAPRAADRRRAPRSVEETARRGEAQQQRPAAGLGAVQPDPPGIQPVLHGCPPRPPRTSGRSPPGPASTSALHRISDPGPHGRRQFRTAAVEPRWASISRCRAPSCSSSRPASPRRRARRAASAAGRPPPAPGRRPSGRPSGRTARTRPLQTRDAAADLVAQPLIQLVQPPATRSARAAARSRRLRIGQFTGHPRAPPVDRPGPRRLSHSAAYAGGSPAAACRRRQQHQGQRVLARELPARAGARVRRVSSSTTA